MLINSDPLCHVDILIQTMANGVSTLKLVFPLFDEGRWDRIMESECHELNTPVANEVRQVSAGVPDTRLRLVPRCIYWRRGSAPALGRIFVELHSHSIRVRSWVSWRTDSQRIRAIPVLCTMRQH